MSNLIAVPYFSNLSAETKLATTTTTTTSKLPSSIFCKKIGKKSYHPYLGLPCPNNFAYKRIKKNTLPKSENSLTHIFPPQPTSTPYSQQPLHPQFIPKRDSILAQTETPRQIDKNFEEFNKTNFLNLAATDTVQNFAKIAQSQANKLNPLYKTRTVPKNNFTKKARLDIFDTIF